MRLNELFDIDKDWEEIDSQLNPEVVAQRDHEDQRYTEIANKSKGETPVFDKEDEIPEEDRFTHLPNEDAPQSPGYRGGENAKRRAGAAHRDYNQKDQNGFNGQPTPDFELSQQQLPI